MLAMKVASLLDSCDATAEACKLSSANSELSRSPVSHRSLNAALRGFNRRRAKDYERYVQTSETLLDIAAIRSMLKRAAPE
jgi:hypothetical protein